MVAIYQLVHNEGHGPNKKDGVDAANTTEKALAGTGTGLVGRLLIGKCGRKAAIGQNRTLNNPATSFGGSV